MSRNPATSLGSVISGWFANCRHNSVMRPVFQDRREAGRLLAASLTHYANQEESVVVGLNASAVPVGLEVAHALHLPLELLGDNLEAVRKKQVLLISEGIACGPCAAAAIAALRDRGARQVVLVTPVVSREALVDLWPIANDICFLMAQESVGDLSEWYERLPEFPLREAEELIRSHRSHQCLECGIGTDGVHAGMGQDGASGGSKRGNLRTCASRGKVVKSPSA